MNVFGYDISRAQQQGALNACVSRSFSHEDLETALINQGVPASVGGYHAPRYVAHQAAKRLIKELQTAKRIESRVIGTGPARKTKWFWLLQSL